MYEKHQMVLKEFNGIAQQEEFTVDQTKLLSELHRIMLFGHMSLQVNKCFGEKCMISRTVARNTNVSRDWTAFRSICWIKYILLDK